MGIRRLHGCSGDLWALRHPFLVLVVEGKTEGIAKGGQARLVASVSAALSAISCAVSAEDDRPLPVPMPSRTMVVSPARTVTRTLVE